MDKTSKKIMDEVMMYPLTRCPGCGEIQRGRDWLSMTGNAEDYKCLPMSGEGCGYTWVGGSDERQD